jgi:hypothetical protein
MTRLTLKIVNALGRPNRAELAGEPALTEFVRNGGNHAKSTAITVGSFKAYLR